MQNELAALKKAISAETINTPHLSVARNLFDQITVRLFQHQTDAKKIAEEQAAAKAAEVAAAAKIVELAEAEKLAVTQKLEQAEQVIATPPTA